LNGTTARMDDVKSGHGASRGQLEDIKDCRNPGFRVVGQKNIEGDPLNKQSIKM